MKPKTENFRFVSRRVIPRSAVILLAFPRCAIALSRHILLHEIMCGLLACGMHVVAAAAAVAALVVGDVCAAVL